MKIIIAMIASILILANFGLFYLKITSKQDLQTESPTIERPITQPIYTVTKQETVEIFEQMKADLGPKYAHIKLYFKAGPFGAWSTCDPECKIIITDGAIDFVTTRGEMAYLLGHEFSHHIFRQGNFSYTYPDSYSRIIELAADRLGLILALKLGYSPCSGFTFETRLAMEHGFTKGRSTHPKSLDRIRATALPSCFQNRP